MNKTLTASLRQNMLLYIATALFAMTLTSLSPVVAEMAKNAPAGTAGILFIFNFTGFVVFSLLGGKVVERIGKKQIILLALLGYVFLLPVFSLVELAPVRYAAIFMIGGCGGFIECIVCAFISDLNPSHPEKYVNYSQIGFGFGAIIAPVLVSVFIQYGVGYKAFYIMMAVLSLIVYLVMAATKYPNTEKPEHHNYRLFASMKDSRFIMACVALLLYTSGEIASWGWLSTVLQGQHNLSVVQAGLAVSMFWAAMTAGRYLCGLLIHRISVVRMIVMLSIFATAATLLMMFVSSLYAIYAVSVLLGLSCSSIFPFLCSYGAKYTSLPSGISFSILIVCGNIGGAILPYVTGLIRETAGVNPATVFVAAMFLCVTLCMGIIQMLNHKRVK